MRLVDSVPTACTRRRAMNRPYVTPDFSLLRVIYSVEDIPHMTAAVVHNGQFITLLPKIKRTRTQGLEAV